MVALLPRHMATTRQGKGCRVASTKEKKRGERKAGAHSHTSIVTKIAPLGLELCTQNSAGAKLSARSASHIPLVLMGELRRSEERRKGDIGGVEWSSSSLPASP